MIFFAFSRLEGAARIVVFVWFVVGFSGIELLEFICRFILMLNVFLFSSPFLLVSIIILFVTVRGLLPSFPLSPGLTRSTISAPGEAYRFFEVLLSL